MAELLVVVTGYPVEGEEDERRGPGQRGFKTRRVQPGMVIDFSRSGKPIGIEITAPSKLTLTAFNDVLRELGLPPLK